MEKDKYKKIVEKHKPKEDRLKNGLKAFIVGGIIIIKKFKPKKSWFKASDVLASGVFKSQIQHIFT